VGQFGGRRIAVELKAGQLNAASAVRCFGLADTILGEIMFESARLPPAAAERGESCILVKGDVGCHVTAALAV
jgi:hypothetical protein